MTSVFTDDDVRSMAAALIAEAAGHTWGQAMATLRVSDMCPTETVAGLPGYMWRRLAQVSLDHIAYLPAAIKERAASDEDRHFLSCGV